LWFVQYQENLNMIREPIMKNAKEFLKKIYLYIYMSSFHIF
jgi:hypothetical protein